MRHEMRLDPAPFEKIAREEKTIELRLYDEKRRLLRVGDEIDFARGDDPRQVLRTGVLALHIFPSFRELYESLPLLKCGYDAETVKNAAPEDMKAYYSEEEQEKYGVVGIELRLLGGEQYGDQRGGAR